MAEGLGGGSGPPGKLDQLSIPPSKFYSKSPESEGATKPAPSPRAQNMIQAMTMDQVCVTSRLHRYKKAYLDYRLGTCDRLYSMDILGHHGCVNALAFSKGQEEFLATGGDDQRILVWRMAKLVQGHQKKHTSFSMATKHRSNIFTIDFSCDNSYIFTGSEDAELIKHDFKTGQFVSSYEHLEAVYGVSAHPASPEVVMSASEDGCVYIIDTRLPRRELGHDMLLCEDLDSYQCVVINPMEPRLVAVSSSRKGSVLYDARTRKQVMKYQSTEYPVFREDGVSVCFNSSGTQLFSMYRRHAPTLHSLWEGRALSYFSDVQGAYRNSVTMKSGCFMGQKDEYVVSGSDDFRIYIWKVPPETGQKSSPLNPQVEETAPPVVVSSTLCKWQSEPHLIVPGHRSIVNQTRYSKRHHVLVSSGVEKLIKIWSDFPLNGKQSSVHKSRDPPPRQMYSAEELDRMMSSSSPIDPSDPTQEDKKVLALFDTLLEEEREEGGGGFWEGMYLHPRGIDPFSDSSSDDLLPLPDLLDTSSSEVPWTDEDSDDEEESLDDDDDDDDDDKDNEEDEDDIRDTYGSDADDWYSTEEEERGTGRDSSSSPSLLSDDSASDRISRPAVESVGMVAESGVEGEEGGRGDDAAGGAAKTGGGAVNGEATVAGVNSTLDCADTAARAKREGSKDGLARLLDCSDVVRGGSDTEGMVLCLPKSPQRRSDGPCEGASNQVGMACSLNGEGGAGGGVGSERDRTGEGGATPKASSSKRQRLLQRRANEGDYSQYRLEDFLKTKPAGNFYCRPPSPSHGNSSNE